MTRSQTAAIADFNVGAEATEKVCLLAKIRTDAIGSCKLDFRFFGGFDQAITYTVQTSNDGGSTWADLGADVAPGAKQYLDANRAFARGTHTDVRVTCVATTPDEGRVQLRGDSVLELREMNEASAL